MQSAQIKITISTHTSPTGGDDFLRLFWPLCGDFNPHLPHGRRHFLIYTSLPVFSISTHTSPTGGDNISGVISSPVNISTHTSPTGGDTGSIPIVNFLGNFNPHLPHGRRLLVVLRNYDVKKFQPTPPPREATIVHTCFLRF